MNVHHNRKTIASFCRCRFADNEIQTLEFVKYGREVQPCSLDNIRSDAGEHVLDFRRKDNLGAAWSISKHIIGMPLQAGLDEIGKQLGMGRLPMASSVVHVRIVFFQHRAAKACRDGSELDAAILMDLSIWC